jgi:hypothetical protein
MPGGVGLAAGVDLTATEPEEPRQEDSQIEADDPL